MSDMKKIEDIKNEIAKKEVQIENTSNDIRGLLSEMERINDRMQEMKKELDGYESELETLKENLAEEEAKVQEIENGQADNEDMIICPNCQKPNSKDSKFCISCGHKLFEDKPVLSDDNSGTKTCPNCHTPVLGEYKFCTKCGYDLRNNEVSLDAPTVLMTVDDDQTVMMTEVDEGTVIMGQKPNVINCTIEVISQTDPNRKYQKSIDNGASIVLGRKAGECDIVIDVDKSISSKHLSFEREGVAIYIKDLDSTNGTFINGQRVSERMALPIESIVQIGKENYKINYIWD